MNKLIVKNIFYLILVSVLLILYWPSLNGTAIWDDSSFLFESKFTQSHFPYFDIWKDFNWPVSVTIHKIILSSFGQNFLIFHIINLALHLINSILLFNLLNKFKISYAKWLTILFIFHPANVISVAWMIQLKTLLCFFFSILTLHFFNDSKEKKLSYILSLLFFILSLLSKSASICLPVAIIFFQLKTNHHHKQYLKVIPFFIVSLLASYRLLKSPVTIESTQSLKNQTSFLKGHLTDKKLLPPPAKEVIKNNQSIHFEIDKKMDYILGTSHYYFWQVFIPQKNSPIKEAEVPPYQPLYYLHLFFLILLFVIFWKKNSFYYILAGYSMLLPFSGIIPAPFMNLTWVSDQHLYLVIPLFLAFMFEIGLTIRSKSPTFITFLLIPFFIYKVYEAIPAYENEIAFYESSINYDPLNLPIGYNLAMSYLKKNDLNSAVNIVEHFIHMSEVVPALKKNRYFPEMFLLYLRLKPHEEKIK